MCLYGIELLVGNIAECRANMLEILADYLNVDEADELYRAASHVLSQNLVHGDAITMRTHCGYPITFAEWGYLGKGKFSDVTSALTFSPVRLPSVPKVRSSLTWGSTRSSHP